MNHTKSKVWFSPNTLKVKRKGFVDKFGIQLVNKFGKYLGTYIDELNRRNDIGKELIRKLNRKLQGWKTRVLS